MAFAATFQTLTTAMLGGQGAPGPSLAARGGAGGAATREAVCFLQN